MAIILGESPRATLTTRLAGETAFIIVSGDQEVDAETCRLIRSCVMLGRNPNTKCGSIISSYSGSTDLSGSTSQPAPSSLMQNKVGSNFSFA
jgi:hypothetical protein